MVLRASDVDFVAYDDRGQALLLVEVKSKHQPTELWAAQFRRNMLAHGTLPAARFFLIATPERMYFWRQDDPVPQEGPPQFTLDATRELQPYFEKFSLTPDEASGEALELTVFAWLHDIAESAKSNVKQDPSRRWLAESGLLEALRRARIEPGRAQ